MNSRIVLTIYFLLLLALVGGGYALFLWFIVNVAKGGLVLGLVTVAVVAGISSFFNPCAFPLLPALFSGVSGEGREAKINPLTASLTTSLGVTTFNILLGALLGLAGAAIGSSFALAGGQPSAAVLWLRGAAGVLIFFLGINHFTGRGIDFHKIENKVAKVFAFSQQSSWRFFSYGFGYTLLGIGCGGPILTGLIVYSIASGGFLSALSAFAIYAAVMAILMIIVATLVVLSQKSILTTLRASTATIKKISGIILAAAGIFLILSTVFVQEFTSLLFPS